MKEIGESEDRKSDRSRVCKKLFASLWPRVDVAGPVSEIGRDGLTFCYPANQDLTRGSSYLTIWSVDHQCRLAQVPIKAAHDYPVTDELSGPSIKVRCCGVEFGVLTSDQRAALGSFIEAHRTAGRGV